METVNTRKIAALLLLAGLLVGCGKPSASPTPGVAASKAASSVEAPPADVPDTPPPSRSVAVTALSTAHTSCLGGSISDDGKTLVMATEGKKGPGDATTRQVGCVLSALQATGDVIEHMFNTVGSDGEQTGSWGNYKAKWTYSTELGLKVTITQK